MDASGRHGSRMDRFTAFGKDGGAKATVTAGSRREFDRLSDAESQTQFGGSDHGIELDDREILVKTQVKITTGPAGVASGDEEHGHDGRTTHSWAGIAK